MGRKEKKATRKSRAAASSPHRSYLPENFEIPQRTSSLAPATVQREIEVLQDTLKRKSSQLSQELGHSNSTEFLKARKELLSNHQEQYELLTIGLRESFEKGELTKESFQSSINRCWIKRAKLTHEKVTITRQQNGLIWGLKEEETERKPDLAAAYAELLTQSFKNAESPAGWQVRSEHQHNSWKMRLRDYYDAYDPSNPDYLWCPILQGYDSNCVAAHIVPHSIGYRNAGYLFGEPDDGMDLIWSMKNGLIMASYLEKQFDRGAFILVPIPTQLNEPTRWKFVLMDEAIAPHRIVSISPLTWKQLDGRELQFKNNQRPGSRYLYYHYVSTLLRYVRFEKPGWAEKRISLPTGKIWATPGLYLRKSMLKQLANVLGYFDADDLFDEGTFEGKDGETAQEERVMAEEIFVDREWPRVAEDIEEIRQEEQEEQDRRKGEDEEEEDTYREA
ncbi:MAG: hypothetical protein M1830_010437 [Pleopsidium flavum]|nr:MAG: hypothetical protein M1830_010437 [Pleopsidium flavum]